ncbi:MAG: sorbosone dehydrogenase family protein [Methyloceanibacter sp.]
MPKTTLTLLFGLLALTLAGCGDQATLAEQAGEGPDPTLPPPKETPFPTVNIAPHKGWPPGGKPKAADGLSVAAYAAGLNHPRWLYVLPNGDVLVAESNTPKKPDEHFSLRGVAKRVALWIFGAGVPSANRITLLRDKDGDGIAEERSAFLSGLNSPFGMALVGDTLYVADTDALLRFTYREGDTKIDAKPEKVADLPAGPINLHWTRNVIASPDGKKLYVTVGSNSNAGEQGMENEQNRAAILEIDPAKGQSPIFASGLRNPNGLAWQPVSGELWTTVNERDFLGSDLVPDYMTAVKEGGIYGWPYSYLGQHLDPRLKPQRPDLVAKAIVPDYALGAHTASLGLAFYQGKLLPERFAGGAFIAQHGSWNRRPRSGFKVIFVPFTEGRPSGMPEDILTGFVDGSGNALGRPAGVAVDRTGGVLIADDVGNAIWRIAPAAAASATASP